MHTHGRTATHHDRQCVTYLLADAAGLSRRTCQLPPH